MIATMNKKSKSIKIDVYDLTKGMYVEDIYDSDGKLLMVSNELIKNNDQIKHIVNRGVESVFVNMEKGDVPIHLIPKEENDSTNETLTIDDYQKQEHPDEVEIEEYYEELEKASKIHKRTITSVKDILNSIKKGRGFIEPEVRDVVSGIVKSLSRNADAIVSTTLMDSHDDYLINHSVNVAILTASTVKMMGFPESQVLEAGIGGLLHDIGMLNIPQKILQKTGKLSDNEYSRIKQHTVMGLEYVNGVKGISDNTKKIILQHHERYDGKGYPFGIKGGRIFNFAMVTAIADVYDALTSHRPYKRAITPQKALAVLYKGINREFDASIVQVFTKNMGVFPIGSFVKLHCGIMGIVIHVDSKNILAPRILELFDKDGNRLDKPKYMNLSQLQKDVDEEFYKIDTSLEPDRFGIDPSKYIGFKI